MSALEDLIQEIADENLRRRNEKEIGTLKGTKKFGLVFEPQNPECTSLYDVLVKKKSLRKKMPRTLWTFETHDARDYGTKILNAISAAESFRSRSHCTLCETR